MAKLVSKTYGEALFELAAEQGKTEEFMEEILALEEILLQNPDFSRLMNHPKILKEEKTQVLNNVFKDRISKELLGFLNLIILKDRYRELNAILTYFTDEVKKVRGIGVAFVTTASVLSDAKQKEVEQKLLATTSFNKMEMHYLVDQELIGGMVIRIGDRVVDSSIRTGLTELQKQLLAVQV